MIEFIIKSSICLAVFYLVYYALFKNNKALQFNRFYLLFTTIFSIVVPFIQVKMQLNSPLSQNLQVLTASTTDFILQGNILNETTGPIFTFSNIVLLLYLLGSSFLLIRLVLNLNRIIKKIKTSQKVNDLLYNIVLVDDKTLPYSFFKFVFINKEDYENKNIDEELISHEHSHCKQFHSIDILLIEMMKVLLWFNPLVWIYKKEIQLNHEYLADNEVIKKHNENTYLNILLNLVFRNNSTYLASNFNYSLTKKRLIMMTKNKTKSIAYRIALFPVITALLFYFISCTKESDKSDDLSNLNVEEWWNPILEKHNITPSAYNNFNNLFEMGTKNSINNRLVTLENAVFIVKTENRGQEYLILTSPLAHHNLETDLISGELGTVKIYGSMKDEKPKRELNLKNFKLKLGNEDNPYDSWDAKEIDVIANP